MAARFISALALYLAVALVEADVVDPNLPQPKNTVTIYKSVFTTLDDNLDEGGPQDNYLSNKFLKLPKGWSIAEDGRDIRIALQLYLWGTPHFVLADKILNTELEVVPGLIIEDEKLGYKTDVTFPSRILIKSNDPAPEEIPPFHTVNITNLITFNDRDYAMVNNADPKGIATDSCDSNSYKLPSGWEIAADNEETRAVMMSTRFPFKHICKVTRSGKGYSFGFIEPKCGSGMLYEYKLDGKSVYTVPDDKCGGLMVSRPNSQSPNTWNGEESITNVYNVKVNDQEHHYAVLDNTPANKPYIKSDCDGGDCCQNVAKKIPVGWELAQSNMPGYTEAASQPWGTSCTGRASNGNICTSNVIKAGAYAAVPSSNCDSRILIKRKPVDCIPQWTSWSSCSTECVQTRRLLRIIGNAVDGGKVCDKEKDTTRKCTDCSGSRPKPSTVISSTTIRNADATTVIYHTTIMAADSTSLSSSTSITSSFNKVNITTTTGVAGATIPSVLAALAAATCALLL